MRQRGKGVPVKGFRWNRRQQPKSPMVRMENMPHRIRSPSQYGETNARLTGSGGMAWLRAAAARYMEEMDDLDERAIRVRHAPAGWKGEDCLVITHAAPTAAGSSCRRRGTRQSPPAVRTLRPIGTEPPGAPAATFTTRRRTPHSSIRRGSFSGVKELLGKIDACATRCNKQTRPFDRVADDSILGKIKRLRSAIFRTRR